MIKPGINELNRLFSLNQKTASVIFKTGNGNMPMVEINNQQASALIGLQGAHLLSWYPKNKDEVIWLSEDACFAEGKSIRGGVPICWPWFGAHEKEKQYPAHGFARTVYWQVKLVEQLDSGDTKIIFKLDTSELESDLQAMWVSPTIVEYSLTIGRVLTLELTTLNNSKDTISISEALHTYFNVDDISQTEVKGLDGITYLDKPDGFKRKKQNADLQISGEVDRVYIDSPNEIEIDDGLKHIDIKTTGSLSTIVWNPGEQVAKKMGDLGDEGYKKMLCVESGNAADNTLAIEPGKSHVLMVQYSI